MKLAEAVAAGYCITSRNSRGATRIDRQDWREYMAKQHAPWDPEGDGMEWVQCLDQHGHSAADHYRRCYSRDNITVPEDWIKSMPKSSSTNIEFRHLPYDKNPLEVQKEILIDMLRFG